ncbi:hypothetical protein NE689_15460 [Lactonifactor longoviformis]|uniref:hypothetical protein n=1 Tax=Lactonifactor longoviformis TaxID=341220 RepID=UPI00210BF1B4|nr:hypothetical protein [Lactonifactor longoviformis]MCQ4672716.1 hypothetical protein [Lactonifactor longoviformis]
MAKKGYRKRVLSFLLAGLLVGTTVGSDLGVTVMASSTGTETPGTPKTADTAFIENTGYASLEAALNAVNEGATAQIDLKADQTINKTLVLKKGQKISIVPKDVPKVTISRVDKFAGDMFDVTAENAVLTLGKQGMTGTLVLDGTAKGLDAGNPLGAVVKKTGDSNLVKNDKVEIVNNILGTVAVTGTPAVGQTLTADVSKVNPSNAVQGLGYQWQRCEDGKQPVDIAGATASTYTITGEDSDKSVQVVVNGTGEFTGSLTSGKTQKISKLTPTFTVPQDIKATYGTRVKDVDPKSDANGKFVWADSIADDTLVGNVGENKEFDAIYKPNDSGTYNEAPAKIKIEVLKAKPNLTFTASRTDIAEPKNDGAEVKLSVTASPVANGEEPKGKISFYEVVNGTHSPLDEIDLKDGKAELTCTKVAIGKHSYGAIYSPIGTENYDSTDAAGVELTITRLEQQLSIQKVENVTYGDDPFTLTVAGAKGNGKMTFSIVEGEKYIDLDTTSGKVTIKGAGKVEIKVEKDGDSNYNPASATVEFTISPMTLKEDDVKITGISSSYTSTGKQIKPTPTVKLGDKKLKKGTDYDLEYGKNTSVGTGTVEIKFKGNYTGTIKKTFKITKKSPASPKKSNAKKSTTSKTKGAKTADNTPISSAMLALLLSGTVGGAIIYKRRRTTK